MVPKIRDLLWLARIINIADKADPKRGTYMRERDGRVIYLGGTASGSMIAYNYIMLLVQAFPENDSVRDVLILMNNVDEIRRLVCCCYCCHLMLF